ncbi:FAD:protein FMN transferase [Maribacter sp. 2-571]|uniref:FAD:protein FMN transferase n=1 Tax=Maribacter sp. 2-571 TaxID=3417569 RepID=UPI003D326CDD
MMDSYQFNAACSSLNRPYRKRAGFGRFLMYFFVWCLLWSVTGCAPAEKPIVQNEATGGALGTSYSIIYQSDRTLDFQTAIDSVFEVVNRSLSTYIPDSDISKINAGDTTVVVDTMFKEVFRLSKEIHQNTDGYFDPTVGVLVNAWGFGPGKAVVMDSVRVDSLLQYVGFDKVGLTEMGTVEKAHPNVYFDFNAIAKGYAIDRLALLMDQRGIADYLLEVGGELVAKGTNKVKKKPWTVGVDDPQVEEGRKLKLLLRLTDRALASSGNYRKFRVDTLTGKKYVHTVDPKTGFTKSANTLAATVLAADCATADAYATAFMAMDLDDALSLISRQNDLEAYIVYLERGVTKEYMTDGFRELVVTD